jgi:hypothetical protein
LVDGHHHRVFPNRNEVLRHGLHVVVDVQEARMPPLETVEPAIAIGVREVGDLHQHELRSKIAVNASSSRDCPARIASAASWANW